MFTRWKKLLIPLFAAAILAAVVLFPSSARMTQAAVPKSTSGLTVYFIDVGQGDATLITCDGHAMLIDAGQNDKGTTVQLFLKKHGVSSLDYAVGTHPDSDHIGGLDVIITKFQIGTVLLSGYQKTTATYRDVQDALQYKNLKAVVPKPGDTYRLGSAKLTVVGPDRTYDTPNNNSICLLLTYGKNSFLFAGDAEEDEEAGMIASKFSLKADVYKVAHHGSRTASTAAFLKAVAPTYAVISCGEGNDYGHPHAEVLNRFRKLGIQVFRTDEDGTIVATSDGKTITFSCPPSTTWKAGEPSASGTEEQIAGTVKSTVSYVLNTNTKKFHRPGCSSAAKISDKNKAVSSESREQLISEGYQPCKICHP